MSFKSYSKITKFLDSYFIVEEECHKTVFFMKNGFKCFFSWFENHYEVAGKGSITLSLDDDDEEDDDDFCHTRKTRG
jgi:hypothetical protein